MITLPPFLKKGDTIGLVAPAGYMPMEKMQACIDTLEDWGYNMVLGATTQSESQNYFSGSDEQRLADLQQMLDDKNVQAVFCARGGYGISRIIDELDFRKFRKNPKWVIGYSDVTVLHAHLFSSYKIASLHAPMAAAFNEDAFGNPYVLSIREALEGKPASYECAPHEFNQKGKATGRLVGGNLSLLAHLVGTPSDVDTEGRILFLEDVGEYLYNIDRMLLQLKRAGRFRKLAGLIIGGFTDNKDTTRPYGKTAYQIIHEAVREYGFPICFGFPVSHEKENYALKVGGTYTLRVKETVTLEE